MTPRRNPSGPERTLRDIGDELGVSAERVRQIEERALDGLRAAAELGLTGPPTRPTSRGVPKTTQEL